MFASPVPLPPQKSVGPNKLNTVRMMRDILLAAHQRTEQSLAKEAKTMRRSLQACTRDLDALKTSTLARAGGLEEVQSAGNAGVASLRAQAAVARDVLYQCYQECVVTCTGVGDGVAAASARFAPLPAEFEQLGKSVAGLCEAVEGHVQWPDLSKYGGEAERFTGEVTRALFAHRSDVAHASTSATSALSSVLTAVRGYHEAVVAKVSQERARSQAAARECVEAATSVCAEVSAVFAEQTATIAELRAQLASVRAASSASTEARVAKLKEQFKGILRRQQAGEAERIATLEVSMKGRIEALQRQLEEVRQGSALAAKEVRLLTLPCTSVASSLQPCLRLMLRCVFPHLTLRRAKPRCPLQRQRLQARMGNASAPCRSSSRYARALCVSPLRCMVALPL